MDCDHIDLDRAEQAVSSLASSDPRQAYQPRTLHHYQNGRNAYLSLFPTKAFGPKNCLLLANVPVNQLGPHEIARRQHGADTLDALMLMNSYDHSNDGFSLSRQDAEELATRLRVGMSIITFNANQLRGICYSLLRLHESFQRNVLDKTHVVLKRPIPNSKQMAIALEFYLQIDVDIFYMKTCSFRGATPRSNIEGLFCGQDEPQAQYTMLPCGQLFCQCCHPPNHGKKSQPWPVIDFASSSMHQFVNRYTTYLNCPVTCNTSNVIYTMTCPCGHYDYVDSTATTLADAMRHHREHGNRIIHQKLTGSPLYRGSPLDPHWKEKEIMNKMRLYQHSARCPVALRSFLDCNPMYWCFIPMLWHEAIAEHVLHLRRIASNVDPEVNNMLMMGTSDNQRVANYLEHVPLPPAVYAFSHQQRQKQRLFFEQFLSSSIHQQPYSELDLYKVAIIAVLPDNCSMILRYIIETLFIIHGETKLNMICPVGGDPERRYGPVYDFDWCNNLNPPSTSSTISIE